nr:M20 family metallopeptidase [Paenibacillus monticola]
MDLSDKLKEQLVEWRRDFHQHPEIGYQEIRTSAIVAKHLRSLGLEVTTNVGGTGVVGLLRGEQEGPTVGLRADMDALPIQDDKEVSYRSMNSGLAHLCGHDAHTTMLMGAAELLCSLGRPPQGNIKFIFQPAEEGFAGAKAMMEDGVLDNPEVEAIVGLHVYPGMSTGTIGIAKGVAFASVDSMEIHIIGKGGHAARPHEGVDAIAVSAQVITALQNIASRMIDPLETVVITIGTIEGGVMGAALAPSVKMVGTIRTLSPAVRDQMPILIERVIRGVTESFGAGYELNYIKSYPAVWNNETMVDKVTEASERLFGSKCWDYIKPSTGGEDFAFYAEAIPGAFFRIGTGNDEARTRYPLHHSHFDLDENALPFGVAILSAVALHYLSSSILSS